MNTVLPTISVSYQTINTHGNMLYYICIVVVVVVVVYLLSQWVQSGKGLVSVLVLGDLGHSPRMQNHVTCLVVLGIKVDFIGYFESGLPSQIGDSKFVKIRPLMPLPKIINKLPRTLRYLAKFTFQTFQLLLVLLCKVPKTRYLLVQSPPAIPTLLVALITSYLRGTKLCVDWHNYGYTLMALQLGETHPIVRIARIYEQSLAKGIQHNFCVTQAMRNDLNLFWGVSAVTLYDKPNPQRFKGRATAGQAHELFVRLSGEYRVFGGGRFTREERGTVSYRRDRPFLLVSGTSWTEDEDFGILLEALREYDVISRKDKGLPSIVCAITGKGPLRGYYETEISKLSLSSVEIETLWLQTQEYPVLLAAADLGVSLHTSSSGLDLPMKVVDMFGSDLPVLARGFKCIEELVRDGTNGFLFNTSSQLCNQLIHLAIGFPDNTQLNRLRTEISLSRQKDTWQQVWNREAALFFTRSSKPWTLYAARLAIFLLGISVVIWGLRLSGMGSLLDAMLADI